MDNICVVTGGGSGMGLETAKILGKNHKIILVGRTVSKLDNAIKELKDLGIDAEAFPGDASDRESVKKLVEYAKSKGNVKTVIHAAGVSPHMADAEKIFTINAVGTINIDEEFAEVMNEGSCILNVSSMSAYMLPEANVPKEVYKLSLKDVDAFKAAANQMLQSVPQEQATGMAYTISKNFVTWFTSRMAVRCGKKGIRVVSISPGTFKTPMGEVEGEEAASFALRGAMGRLGEPEEIAKMMAFMVSDECSYLCGVDILYDGGSVSAMRAMQEDMQ
ncbi:SDR family oxidoreductase [Anaerofustis stercorihominis]|uniref:SDR family oxidoreductase n=1 Tax=Anaerofustis stercorihominis TaxID=214853 RepID=A0A3E3DYR4_9FIRM|nr:SDR family oxidoreductase [Anaerofustis stercorihominis]RGD74412.1 SDR family oxidoreductase [Anaerofustis stercorihominis]